jgi:short chain dehydrogenase
MDMRDFDLTGKICIVTGAGRGMAEGLARHGATVVLTGRTRATLEETAAAIGAQAWVFPADVTKEADIIALRDAVLAQFGRIDVLVNNAGVNPILKTIEKTTLEDWNHILDVNLTGLFLSCKYLGGAIGEGGSVINVSSIAGHGGLLRSASYCASKGGRGTVHQGAGAGLGEARRAGERAGAGLGGYRPDARLPRPRRARHAQPGAHAAGPVRHAARHGGRGDLPGERCVGVHHRAQPGDRWGVDDGVGGTAN